MVLVRNAYGLGSRDVEPGFVVTVGTDTNPAKHGVVVGGFSNDPSGPPSALVYENVLVDPLENVGPGRRKDSPPHRPMLTDSNSPNADAGIWNADSTKATNVLASTKADRSYFRVAEAASAVAAVGPMTYETSAAGAMSNTGDCASVIDLVVDELGGSLNSTPPFSLKHLFTNILGGKTIQDWAKERQEQRPSK